MTYTTNLTMSALIQSGDFSELGMFGEQRNIAVSRKSGWKHSKEEHLSECPRLCLRDRVVQDLSGIGSTNFDYKQDRVERLSKCLCAETHPGLQSYIVVVLVVEWLLSQGIYHSVSDFEKKFGSTWFLLFLGQTIQILRLHCHICKLIRCKLNQIQKQSSKI